MTLYKLAGFVLALGFATSVNASLLYINAEDLGWYDETGSHDPNNDNYIAGVCCDSTHRMYRNFFVFDLGGITDTVTSAVLRLHTERITASATYTLYDVATSIASLVAGGDGLTDTYADLGSGVSYGARDLLVSQSYLDIGIRLNTNALAAINSAGGMFAIGGAYPVNGLEQFAFGNTQQNAYRTLLILNTEAVPAPATLLLLGSGFAGLVCARRRRA